jgi:hypothetical protein
VQPAAARCCGVIPRELYYQVERPTSCCWRCCAFGEIPATPFCALRGGTRAVIPRAVTGPWVPTRTLLLTPYAAARSGECVNKAVEGRVASGGRECDYSCTAVFDISRYPSFWGIKTTVANNQVR